MLLQIYKKIIKKTKILRKLKPLYAALIKILKCYVNLDDLYPIPWQYYYNQ